MNRGVPGIGIKGKEMALVWHEKASRTALQTGTVTLHTLFWYRHTHMTFPPPGEYKYKQILTEHREYVLSRPGSGLIPDPGFHSVYSWILEPKYTYIYKFQFLTSHLLLLHIYIS